MSFNIQAYTFELVYKAENGNAEALQQLKLNNYIDIASRVCNSFYK